VPAGAADERRRHEHDELDELQRAGVRVPCDAAIAGGRAGLRGGDGRGRRVLPRAKGVEDARGAGVTLASSPLPFPKLGEASRFDPDAARALAREHYGLDAKATALPSERDQNFLLETAKGERMVLKIANAGEGRAMLDAQQRAMAHLAMAHLAMAHVAPQLSVVPRVVPATNGEHLVEITAAGGRRHFIWAITWLPGVTLGTVPHRTPELLEDLGRTVGALSRGLAGFDHEAIHRDFYWDLANARRIVAEHRAGISDAALGKAIDVLARAFDGHTAPLLGALRRSAVHNDLNDYNVLVGGGNGHATGNQRITGIVDFGDMVFGWTAGDLAIAIAYAILGAADPLGAAASVARGCHRVFPLTDAELGALFGLVTMRLCASACIAVSQQKQEPGNVYLAVSQEAIRRALPRLATVPFPFAEAVLRKACGADEPAAAAARVHARTKAETLAARGRHLAHNLSLSYRDPVRIVRGERQYLFDDEGRRYLDAYNNVAHVGHCHPRVVRAGAEQMALLNTNTRYLSDLLTDYAGRLTSLFPEPLRVCFFVNSASEANELALRLARAHTRQRDTIVLEAAYHGNTTTLIELSPYKHAGPGGSGAPEWVHVAPMPDDYRGAYKRGDPDAGRKYADRVAEIVARERSGGRGLAGFIAETCPSVGGQIIPPAGYLAAAYRHVRDAGGVCIADEVQTGLGRIGTHCWAFEAQGVVPDIVVLGKPLGNGHPIGAVVTTPGIAASFDNGMEFFSTFGGNTVSCAIGLAVLDVMRDEGLQAHALSVGERLLAGLRPLAGEFAIVGDVRGSGFFVGVELVRNRETLEPAGAEAEFVANGMRERGILLGTDGPHHNVVKIRPPMPFSEADADLLVETLGEVLRLVPRSSG
jgi:4-aminobutyrate aminotransferase-like enzyme